MAVNNFKLFDEAKSNMLTDAQYNTNTQRINGVQSGVASSPLNNKFSYQMSLVAYAVASLMVSNGFDATDSLAVSTFVSNLSNSVLQKVIDKATTEEAQTGAVDTKWMTPSKVTAFYNNKRATEEQAIAGVDNVSYMTALRVKQAVGPQTESLQPKVGDVRISAAQFPDRDEKYIPCDGSVITSEQYPELYNTLVNNGFVRGIEETMFNVVSTGTTFAEANTFLFMVDDEHYLRVTVKAYALSTPVNSVEITKSTISGVKVWTFQKEISNTSYYNNLTSYKFYSSVCNGYIVGVFYPVMSASNISSPWTASGSSCFFYKYTGEENPGDLFYLEYTRKVSGINRSHFQAKPYVDFDGNFINVYVCAWAGSTSDMVLKARYSFDINTGNITTSSDGSFVDTTGALVNRSGNVSVNTNMVIRSTNRPEKNVAVSVNGAPVYIVNSAFSFVVTSVDRSNFFVYSSSTIEKWGRVDVVNGVPVLSEFRPPNRDIFWNTAYQSVSGFGGFPLYTDDTNVYNSVATTYYFPPPLGASGDGMYTEFYSITDKGSKTSVVVSQGSGFSSNLFYGVAGYKNVKYTYLGRLSGTNPRAYLFMNSVILPVMFNEQFQVQNFVHIKALP